MFGIDPVTGRTDRRVISAVFGGPEQLVSGEVRGSRYLLSPTPRFSSSTRTTARAATSTTCGGWSRCRVGREGVRRPARRRVGHRRRRPAVAAPVAARHHRDPGRAARTDLRTGPGRGDVPRAAHRARARPLGPAAARCGARGGAARGHGDERRVEASDIVVSVDGHVAIDLKLAGEIVPKQRPARSSSTRSRPCAGCAVPGGSVGCARPCPAWPSTSSTASTPTSRRCPRSPTSRAASSSPCSTAATRPARAARPRDPHGHAHRHRPQPDDRRVGCAARARRSTTGRPERRRDPRAQPDRACADRAAGRCRGRRCPPRRRRFISAATRTTPTTTGSCARRCACACAGCRSSRAGPRGSSVCGSPRSDSSPSPSSSAT